MYVQTSMKYGQALPYSPPPIRLRRRFHLLHAGSLIQRGSRPPEKNRSCSTRASRSPSQLEELRLEDMETAPYCLHHHARKETLSQLRAQPAKGSTAGLDLSYPSPSRSRPKQVQPLAKDDAGCWSCPGNTGEHFQGDPNVSPVGGGQEFTAKVLANATLPAPDRPALVRFQKQVAELTRICRGPWNWPRVERQTGAHQAGLAPRQGHCRPDGLAIAEKRNWTNRLRHRGLEPKASDEEIPPAHMPLWSRLSTIITTSSHNRWPGQEPRRGVKIVREELARCCSS